MSTQSISVKRGNRRVLQDVTVEVRSGEVRCLLGANGAGKTCLLEALGVEVLRLVRVSIGPLELGELKKGEVRPLTDGEKRFVDHALDRGSKSK